MLRTHIIKTVAITKVTKAIKMAITMINTTSKELLASNNTKVRVVVEATIPKKTLRLSVTSP